MGTPQKSAIVFTSVKQLIYQRKFHEAIHIIQNFEVKNHLTHKERLTCQILKGQLMNRMDKYEDALKIGEAVLKASQESKIPLLEVDALLLLCNSLIFLRKLDKGLNSLQKCEKIITAQKAAKDAEITSRESTLLYYKGQISLYKGQLDQSLDYLQRSLSLSEEINDNRGMVESLRTIGLIYAQKGKLNHALSAYQRSYRLSKKIGYKEGLARVLNNIGIIHRWKGELNDALAYYQQSLDLFEEIKHTRGVAMSFNNMGLIYHGKGEINSALNCYKKSLSFFEEIGDIISIAASLNNLGSLYQQKNNFDLALECLEKSFELKQQIGNDLDISKTLFSLISVALDRHSLKQAQEYLQDLEQINDRNDSIIINQAYSLACGMVLNSSNRLKDKAEAQKLFEKVSNEEVLEFTLTTTAMLQLFNSLLFELKALGDRRLLNELKKLANNILDLSKKQDSHWLLAEAYLLQSKLALIDFEIEKAVHLLTQSQKIADEKGLQGLAMQISKEHDTLLEQIDNWKDFNKHNVSLAERVQISHLKESVEQIIQKKIRIIPELPPEEPMIFLILTKAGLIAYSKFFNLAIQINKSLVGAFISAIRMFSEQTFSQSIDRIKLKEYTILVRLDEPFLLCYVFKGQTYTAQQKLNHFAQLLRSASLMWGSLLEFMETSRFIEEEAQSKLEYLVVSTFQ
ncbi:MAG: tetratricopeptide repeat protein [Candidatus Hermodarchaeota archaeon]